ncbi:hypothetical protein [Chryseobacterium cucumeris]|uniref:hypothetical protein n=1 Tax=Chryseobacterium cucumeris TaxID=1813611 RepID=UPI0023F4090D|nr:hypothetical protein [Chryseobacterium cucumeris]
MNYLKKNITLILIISQIFGLYGGMLQAPRLLAILFLPLLIQDLNKKLIKGKEYLLFFFSFIMYCVLSMLFLTFNNDQSLKEFAYALINFIIFVEIVNFSKYISLNKMTDQQKLIDAVLDQIAEDLSIEDFTAIEEMLKQVLNQTFEPKKILELYLPIEGRIK